MFVCVRTVELEQKLAKEGNPIPGEIKSDPEKYHRFVMQRMQALEQDALEVRAKAAGGNSGFLTRFAKGDLFKAKSVRPIMVTLGTVQQVGGSGLLEGSRSRSEDPDHI